MKISLHAIFVMVAISLAVNPNCVKSVFKFYALIVEMAFSPKHLCAEIVRRSYAESANNISMEKINLNLGIIK